MAWSDHGIDTDIAPANTSRYTYDGDEAVEARIHRDQELIAAAVEKALPGPELRAVVLMGGYGRGEGGFTMIDGKPAPYNDYDYFIVVRGMDKAAIRAAEPRLAKVAKELEKQVGVEVDFFFLREETLPSSEYSLMNAEMIWGHRVIQGDPNILDAMPAMPFKTLPLGEFGRLMLNRGSLLLMNRMTQAEGGPADATSREVFVKYLFKASLAAGDALLAAAGRYHPSFPAKVERLAELDWPRHGEILEQYKLAVDAKFHPDYAQHIGKDLNAWQDHVTGLWLDAMNTLESTRLGQPIKDWESYAEPSIAKGQSEATLRNLAINLRDFGPMELLRNPAWARRYPRERLIGALPLLLRGDTPPPVVLKALSHRDSSWSSTAKRFLELWARYA